MSTRGRVVNQWNRECLSELGRLDNSLNECGGLRCPRPNEIFARRGNRVLTLDDAYLLQRAVAQLRIGRGETLSRL